MQPSLIALLLGAALLHAVWNAMAKSAGSPLYSLAAYHLCGSLLALALVPLVPTPHPDSWGCILASVLLHNLYYFALGHAYRIGELSLMYPLFRGLAPVLVALGAGVVAGEWLTTGALAGVASISIGLMGLTVFGGQIGRLPGKTICWGLIIACLIAMYTVVDGLGVRLAGDYRAYIVWLFLLEAVPICGFLLATRRQAFTRFIAGNTVTILLGGVFSSLAYGLVIYAMSLNAMALVSALRETSVIFAAIIGAVLLRESFGKQRIIAAVLIAAGILVLHQFT